MAAIDKMYVHSYYDYDDLRRWAFVYYPELLFYFYDITFTNERYEKNKNEWIMHEKVIIKKEHQKIGNPMDIPCDSVQKLIEYYKKTANYDCSKEQAEHEVHYIMDRYQDMLDGTLEDNYTFPVLNTPLKVDRKLLWICPVSCVREYLEKQCGYKTRWYHKLFWRGKKHF